MQASSVSTNYHFVKNWLKVNRDTNIQRIPETVEAPTPFRPCVIEGFDKAILAFANAIQANEKNAEKLLRLSDKLRNAAIDCNNDSFKNTLALLNFCLSKGISDVQLLQGCSLNNGVLEIEECALPISEELLNFMEMFNFNFRIAGTQEQFSAKLFRNYIPFHPSLDDYRPKNQNWNGLTLFISDVSLLILNGFKQNFLKKGKLENSSSSLQKGHALQQLSVLIHMTRCPVLNVWLNNVHRLLEQNACHPFLLKRLYEDKIIIGLNDFPIPKTSLELMKQLDLPVKVEGSDECFAANVFAPLAERFTQVQDFHPQNYSWGNKDIYVSRALFSLAPFYESLQAMNSRSSIAEESSNFESLQGLEEALAYLATRNPAVIKDVVNVYLFSQAYCITEVKEECAKQLAILTSENPTTTWTLSHYLSNLPFEEDSFTRVMDRGFALSAKDFPLNEILISEIEASESAFIVFEESDLFFAKKAFLEIVKQANTKGQSLSLKDFLPHPDLEWLALIQSEQVGGSEIIDSKIFQKNQKAIKALATYLRTRDIENLIEFKKIIDWYYFFNKFSRACETLANVLECKCKYFEIKWAVDSLIRNEYVNWLLKETPGLSFAKKLQSIKEEHLSTTDELYLKGDDFGFSLSQNSDGTWRFFLNGFHRKVLGPDITSKLEEIPFSWVLFSRGINDEILKKLTSQSTTSLFLTDPNITLEGMRHIATLPLKDLTIKSDSLNDEWLEFIPKTVEYLVLRKGKLTIKGLKKISHLPLKSLILESDSIEDSALIALKGMPLKELSFSFCDGINGSGLRHLQSAWLNKVDLGYTKVDDEGFAHLAHMPFEEIQLPSTQITDRTIDILAKMSLKKLHLTCTNISDVGVEQLLNKKLSYIYLDDTNVSEELKNRFLELGIIPYLSKKAYKKNRQKAVSPGKEKETGYKDSSLTAQEGNASAIDGEKEIEKGIPADEGDEGFEKEIYSSDENNSKQDSALDVNERAEVDENRVKQKKKVKKSKKTDNHPPIPSTSRLTDNQFLLYSTAIVATALFIWVVKK